MYKKLTFRTQNVLTFNFSDLVKDECYILSIQNVEGIVRILGYLDGRM